MKVLFDSNIYVSRILHGGLPAQVLKIATQAGLTICVSDTILDEVRDVLTRHGIRAPLVSAMAREIRRTARPVKIHTRKFWEASLTKEDNNVLVAAVAANADYLVTGDKKLRAVGRVRRTQIVTPREFITVLVHAGYLVRGDF